MKRILPLLLAFALAAPSAHALVYTSELSFPSAPAAALADFPVLVRISATTPSGFSYADCPDASHLWFADAGDAPLPFEVDTWDTNGTSLVWVSVPSLSATATITMNWSDDTANVPGALPASREVWTRAGYRAVWHFAGSAAESVTNLAATAVGSPSYNGNASYPGPLGTTLWLNGASHLYFANNPSWATIGENSTLTISCWARATGGQYARMISTMSDWKNPTGYELTTQTSCSEITVGSSGGSQFQTAISPGVNTAWRHFTATYAGTTATLYVDGASAKSATLNPVVAPTQILALGSASGTQGANLWNGGLDEVRIRAAASTAAWVAAEYATMTDATYVACGAAATDLTAPTIATPVVTRAADGTFTVAAEVSVNVPAAIVCVADNDVTNTMATADAALPMTYSAALAGLAADTTYVGVVAATSTGGSVVKAACPTAFHTGDLSVSKVSDANRTGLVPGAFRVTRADTAHDLAVAYTIGGTATPGQIYAALSGTATIPAGATSVDIPVVPLANMQATSDTTVTVTLAAGLYGIDANAGTATLTIGGYRPIQPTDFAWKTTATPSATALAKIGDSVWPDFPVLLRLPAAVSAKLRTANGTDLFVQNENDASLPFEVDTFDSAGETLVWVKVPALSSATELTVYFGGDANHDNAPTNVWSDYVGVWHMGEASGAVADATGHGLAASPANSTAVSVAHPGGKIGTARQTATSSKKDYLTIPSYDSQNVGANFTFSCWYDATARPGYDRLVSRKRSYGDSNGWEVEMANSNTKLSARGASDASVSATIPDLVSSGWQLFTFVYAGSSLKIYLDGVQVGSGSITAATDNGYPLSIGCDSDGSEAFFVGYVDEARLRKGALTAAGVALEHATMADPAFFDYEDVASTDPTATVFETPTAVRNADGTFTVTVVLVQNDGDVGALYDAGASAVTNVIATAASPGTYADTPANLAADTTYAFAAYGKNASDTEVVKKGGVFYNGDLSISVLSNAVERGVVPGAVRVSRGDAAHDLVVALSIGGTAVAGQAYEALPATVTIPAGATFVDLRVQPLLDPDTTSNTVVSVSIASGLYGVSALAGTADVTVENLVAPSGFNVWIAPADGLASVGSNWSAGHAPTASENVLFDGSFSTYNCEWDAAAGATVASWTQNANYTGTVQIDTTYDATFPALNVTGDVAILGGNWTHPANDSSETYRLKAAIGGNFSLAAGAAIDVTCKGYAKNKFPSGSGKGVHGGGCGGCGATYGDPFVPERPGAGFDTPGGGAVYLVVAGAATVNGTITTQASQGSTTASAYGAPGSIYLQAASIGGSGYVYANNPGGKCCAGGRIALHATNAVEIGIPVSHMSVQGGFSSVRGGSGTLLLRTKNQEHGVLYIDTPTRTNYFTSGYPTSDETTVIPSGQNWVVDGLDFRNSGILTVGPGTTLTLANGFSSITGGARTAGLLYNGGTIVSAQASSETLSGAWTFQANRNYAFPGDVTVRNGASIGGLRLYQVTNYVGRVDYLCDVRVNGDLTVESGGFLCGDFSGYTYKTFANDGSYQNCERFGDPYAHGGQIYLSGNGTYGSILDPTMPGTYGQTDDRNTQNLGGGALKLVVDGALTIDGTVTSVGGTSSGSGQGSGGSVNITAGSLSGNGTMSASGCTATGATTALSDMAYMLKHRGVKSASAGGRIAVRLTGSGASFSDHWIESIHATGALNMNGKAVFTNGCASAGTVYLQTASEGEGGGTIYVRNGNQTANPASTPIPSLRWGGENDDLRKTSLVVGDCGRVKLFADLTMVELYMTAGTALDLNGHVFTVKTAHVDGINVIPGTYTAAQLAARGFAGVVDTSDGAGGTLRVLGSGTMLILR